MPVNVSYPGVYIEEIPSTTKTVTGVSTSATAFVDFFARGPMSDGENANAVRISSFRDFERVFGGLDGRSEASYGLMQFFNNGGETAWVVRCDDGTGLASFRKVEVRIPYLNDFAKDAVDAARTAARCANRAIGVVQVTESFHGAVEAVGKLPPLGPGAAAETAGKALSDTKVTKEMDKRRLAGVYSKIRTAVNAADAAVESLGEEASDELKGQLDAAKADLERVDTRKDAEELYKSVTTARKSAIAAAGAAAEAAKAKDTYEETAPNAIGNAVGEAERAAGALRQIHYAIGWGANEAKDDLPTEFEDVKAAVEKIRSAHLAARAAIEVAQGSPEEIDTVKAEQALAKAVSDLKNAGDPPEADKLKAAAESAGAAAEEANTVAEAARGGETPAKVRAFEDALYGKEGAEAAVQASREKHGAVDAANSQSIVDAILEAQAALGKVHAACVAGLELAPDHPGVDSSGWPDIARAADIAATRTLEAAEATREAGEAADAAGKVLAERVLQEEAASGAIAERTKAAAKAAADKAGGAKVAAQHAADEAETAAKLVTIDEEGHESLADGPEAIGHAKETILDVVDAAEKAAEAAAEAAEAATEAHIAAMEAGEAGAPPNLTISAFSPGVWGNNLRVAVLNAPQYKFNIHVRETAVRGGRTVIVNSEDYLNLTLQDLESPSFAIDKVNHESNLIRLSYKGPVVRGARPLGDGVVGGGDVKYMLQPLKDGRDGKPPRAEHLLPAMHNALDNIAPDVFNILCLPITGVYASSEASVAITDALQYCKSKRAFMIVDIPPTVKSVDQMKKWMGRYGNAANYCGAVYFPRLIVPDPKQNYRPRNVAPSGTLAGVYARTDSTRGIWKAPAGVTAGLQGVEVAVKLDDEASGLLNPIGVNVLRAFPVYGNVSWGGRTLAGADQMQSEWKYVNVRRLVSYIEESLYQSLKWAVFEPNGADLWTSISMQVGGFLGGLFADGAFAGGSPEEAFFVHCDATTTTPLDIERGIVNIIVGIAPSKPAEFIILHIEQIAGLE